MAMNNKDLTNINFDHDWKCYCQQSNDKTDKKTIVSLANNNNTNQNWSPVELPHIIDVVERSCKWWYRKQFDWLPDQRVYLNFEPSDSHAKKSNIKAVIWLNGTQIFSGSLTSLKNPIELSSKLLYIENKHHNILVIRCTNTNLSLHSCLLIHGKVICATGQVTIDEENLDKYEDSDKIQNHVLQYTVSVDDTDGRIDMIFDTKRKSMTISTPPLKDSSQSMDNKNQINKEKENLDDVLLVPRLSIVILIVGTRGDVQPFIALGQALRTAGHRVRLATHETFRSFVRGNGLEFYPLAGDPADLISFMVKNAGIIPSMNSIIEGDIGKKRRCLADILASTWQACIADDDETNAPFTAEAIIANPPSFGHIHCAEKLQIPLHIMFTMPWSPTIAFAHPLSNINNSNGPNEKINLYSYDVIEMLTWTGMRDIVNNFRKKILDLKELHTRQAINALIDERVPHTYCWSPSLVVKPNDWGTHIDVSGFFFLNLGTTFTDPPKDLLEFLGINQNGDHTDPHLPPIYIGFGSIAGHDSRRILEVVVDALDRTGYRALLSGLATDTDNLPPSIFKIGNVPHDWLFQYVSAVCHHGGAGTTAAGLRAGRPTIIVPFFGDQFFWGNVIEKSGAGPRPLPGKSITVDELAEAFRFVHKPTTRDAAERIRDAILKEDGCAAAVHAFYANLPLTNMHSDLEPTFAACYYSDKYNIQISRPVAQVLVAAGALEESELRHHVTRKWQFMHDNRRHLPIHGIIQHSQKAFSSMFIDTAADLKRASSNDNPTLGKLEGAGSVAKGFGLGVGHLTIGCFSLYGEVTDALDLVTSLYDPYSAAKERKRPRVNDFKSGAKAAGLSLWNGWKDGITGIATQPRVGYERHGVLGCAAGSLIATVNLGMKPAVGTLSSFTWLTRGTYASVKKTIEAYRNEGRHISTNLFDTASSTKSDEQLQEDDDKEISLAAKMATARSGFHPKVCQRILDEFEKIKMEQEKNMASSKKKNKTITSSFSNTQVDVLIDSSKLKTK